MDYSRQRSIVAVRRDLRR